MIQKTFTAILTIPLLAGVLSAGSQGPGPARGCWELMQTNDVVPVEAENDCHPQRKPIRAHDR